MQKSSFISILFIILLSSIPLVARQSKAKKLRAARLKEREQRAKQRRKDSKTISLLALDEARERKNTLLRTNKPLAQKYLEHLLSKSEDLAEIKKMRLELADIKFDLGKLEQAEEDYRTYLDFYPSSDKKEYVEFKSILCCFYATLSSDRDQTKTKDAIELSKQYLNEPLYTAYHRDVITIQEQCYNKLLESEINIFHFYLKNDKVKSAQQRLAYIKQEFEGKVTRLKPHILSLECALAEKQGNRTLAHEKKAELAATQLPEAGYYKYAKNTPARMKNYTAMF